ncbi:TetR/AcrR family transcriptional regulator [Kutzneria sp. NPDC052558]|uniref:TetR/AcrR family transcriptional regulator n=1 Tax=Kutzneria sp. NPDC052558 TaxID=3364121 RepID=UPI0037C8A31C
MTRTVTGTYGGVSAEQRRAERRRRLLDAALDVIGTQGWSSTTLRGVCERAKVGPRFFYESFADLDALAAALHDEILEAVLARVLVAVDAAPDDLPARTTAVFHAVISEFLDDPRRARVLWVEAYGSEALLRRRFAAMRRLARMAVEQSQDLLDLPPDGDRVLRAVAMMLTGGVTEFVLAWLDGGMDLSRDELAEISVEYALTVGREIPAIADRLSRSRSDS